MNSKPIILLDDEPNALQAVRAALLSFKYSNIVMCSRIDEFWDSLKQLGSELVFLDLIMPSISGEDILKSLTEGYPDIPVIMTTGVNELETAVRCMRNGAFDYLVKPIDREQLKTAVSRVMKFRELEICNEALATSLWNQKLHNPAAFEAIHTNSQMMHSIFRYIEAVAPSSNAILITGETGSGKELIAHSIHDVSNRHGELVTLNVAGLDDTVFSDTLFGHIKGAFTGADSSRSGAVEKASDGTLFLDEIGDLSIASQVKLLRLLQENEYMPLGTDTIKRSTCRIVAATSKSLEELKNSNNFRKDLFYRLKMHHVRVPPLRERKEDIPLLVQLFLERAAKEFKKRIPTPHPEIYNLLSTWHFPGNIRELKAIIFDAVAKHEGKIMSLSAIKTAISPGDLKSVSDNSNANSQPKIIFTDELPTFKEAEAILLKEALRRANGNQAITAHLLGVSRSAISQRISKSTE